MLNRWNFLKTGFYEGIKLAYGDQGRIEESQRQIDQKKPIATEETMKKHRQPLTSVALYARVSSDEQT